MYTTDTENVVIVFQKPEIERFQAPLRHSCGTMQTKPNFLYFKILLSTIHPELKRQAARLLGASLNSPERLGAEMYNTAHCSQ